MEPAVDPDPRQNPVRFGDALIWDDLIESLNPAALILRIESRMSPAVRNRLSPEDIWQETLLHAWRDRERFEWQGLPSFRRWILQIAENRIRDAFDRFSSLRQGGNNATFDVHANSSTPGILPFESATPSRVASASETAAAMRDALDSLPDLVREVVRRRVFEEHSHERIANDLGLSSAAVKHRLRSGCALYRERLRARLPRSRDDLGNA